MDTGIGQRAARPSLTRRLTHFWHRRQTRWLARRVPAVSELQLGRPTIFIIPTLQGALTGSVALCISLISLAQRNIVGVLLASLILSLFLVCLIVTYRNLSGLCIHRATTAHTGVGYHCFAGEQARFWVQLDAGRSGRKHQQLTVGFDRHSAQTIAVIKNDGITVELQQPALRRGLMIAPRLQIGSDYPLGLWQAWSRPDMSLQCLVFPSPVVCKIPDEFHQRRGTQAGILKAASLRGNDDFAGLREYQQGDTSRQIHWQSLARGHGLKTRQFIHEQPPGVLLDWDMFSGRDTEQILGCLCYQILQLNRQQIPVGLRIPGTHVLPGAGDAHKYRLLSVLALFPDDLLLTKAIF
ncbi:DUF58 domain-containing protein [Gammaproteobacteria bacterium LSUCC0112]|nr:DUF58 domain-containing protein [Gammaproteobacteria bacterium LSUCC0112]